ncbi:MAG: glycosyltransferase family 2 protein [bacterium]|nr:glycosyltransferase family 2 protein [bacterium]
MPTQPFLSIIIPAYNEERRIAATLLAIDKYVNARRFKDILRDEGYARDGEGYEILVVSDGSKDTTVKIVERFSTLIRNLRLVANDQNHGKGYVVRQGMLEARGLFRLFTDADNATPIEEIEKLLPYIKNVKWRGHGAAKDSGLYDVVIGSIGIKGSAVERAESLPRVVLGKMSNWLIQIVAVWGIHDTQRGFKLFTQEAAKDIFSRLYIDRWGFDIEALAVARKFAYRIKEVPVHWIHDPDSKVGPSAYIKTFWELFKIKWLLLTNAHLKKSPMTKQQ